MKWIYQQAPDVHDLVRILRESLSRKQRVVWLVSGGSNVELAVEVLRHLEEYGTEQLVILQTDERFVDPKSPECNWLQLQQAGFTPTNATQYPVLENDTDSVETVRSRYARIVEREFAAAQVIVGQFGIGADGHTAGVLPHTIGVTSPEMVCSFEGSDYLRISLTLAAIARCNQAFVYAFGATKHPALQALEAGIQTVSELPAAVFRTMNSMIYSDYVGGKS